MPPNEYRILKCFNHLRKISPAFPQRLKQSNSVPRTKCPIFKADKINHKKVIKRGKLMLEKGKSLWVLLFQVFFKQNLPRKITVKVFWNPHRGDRQ